MHLRAFRISPTIWRTGNGAPKTERPRVRSSQTKRSWTRAAAVCATGCFSFGVLWMGLMVILEPLRGSFLVLMSQFVGWLLQLYTIDSIALSPQSMPGSALQQCLDRVFESSHSSLSYPQHRFFHLTAVRPWNRNVHIVPAAVTRPQTSEDISAVVRCAARQGVKVQPRSGGHSFGGYGAVRS